MPIDASTSLSKGYAFVEFATAQEAQAAREQTHGEVMPCEASWSFDFLWTLFLLCRICVGQEAHFCCQHV